MEPIDPKEIVKCPCTAFGSMDEVQVALQTDDRTSTLIQWLSGSIQDEAFQKGRNLSCGNQCSQRVNTSLSILNAIRDACRPFLESAGGKKDSPSKPVVSQASYEEAFPSLGSTVTPIKKENILVGRKKSSNADGALKKPKRRIRPAAIAPTPPSAWGQVASTTTGDRSIREGNLVNIPSEAPLVLGNSFRSTQSPTNVSSSDNDPVGAQSASDFVTPIKKKAVVSSVKESSESVATDQRLKNLIEVYCTLIQSSIAPSTCLELHLLIRLLTLADKGDRREDLTTAEQESPLVEILSTAQRCSYFASQSFAKLSYVLRGIGTPLLRELIRCSVFRTQLPDLTREFEVVVEKQDARGDRALGMGTLSQTALLTLPFNEERDSRHNYRTREDQALYKNREESRDAFLYQLRSFLNVRGKLVDSAQATKAIQKIKTSSRVVIDGLLDSNLSWFAEFFCDLLLQVGHVPLQETDKDLLSIADKDKLQKLHRRFSSKVSQSNKSSKRIVADPKRNTKALSPIDDAQHYFPGHQEFFFLFLTSANSYTFGIHLRNKMIANILELSSDVASRKDFEKRLMDLRLIARFLGVLIFSPQWQASGTVMAIQRRQLSVASDGIAQLGACGLSVVDAVEKAWTRCNLVSVVPWVVELLKMSLWDRVVKRSTNYKRLVGLLRGIQVQLNRSGTGPVSHIEASARQLVVLCTESLFDETIGLTKIASCSPIYLPTIESPHNGDECAGLDRSEVSVSDTMLYASNSHVEELISLVSNLSRADASAFRSPGISRKLRPSLVISPTLVRSRSTGSPSPRGSTDVKDRFGFRDDLDANTDSVQAELRDTFFHQHAELKNVCEFSVDRVLRIVAEQLPVKCIQPQLCNRVTKESVDPAAERDALDASMSFLEKTLRETLAQTLAILAPAPSNRKVIEVAASLSVVHGLQAGKTMIKALIISEVRSMQASIARDDRKQLFAKQTVSEDELDDKHNSSLLLVTDAMTRLSAELGRPSGFESAGPLLQEAINALDDWKKQIDSKIPAECDLRSFFASVLHLDQHSSRLLDWVFTPSSFDVKWSVLVAHLRLSMTIARFSRHGLRGVRAYVHGPASLRRIIQLGNSVGQADTLVILLTDLVKARFCRRASLEEVLLETDNTAATEFVRDECLRRLAGSKP